VQIERLARPFLASLGGAIIVSTIFAPFLGRDMMPGQMGKMLTL